MADAFESQWNGAKFRTGAGRDVAPLTVDAIIYDLICNQEFLFFSKGGRVWSQVIGNQDFQNGRCHICFSLGLDKVETGHNLLME